MSTPVHADVATIRARYPEALVCIGCGRLLATCRESYAKSNLTEEARLAYVCAECRQDGGEAARTLAARQANMRAARAAKKGAGGARKRAPVSLPAPDVSRPSRTRMNTGDSRGVFVTVQSRRRGSTTRRGGRPIRYLTDEERQRANRERARTFRARHRHPDPVPA